MQTLHQIHRHRRSRVQNINDLFARFLSFVLVESFAEKEQNKNSSFILLQCFIVNMYRNGVDE